ncbi:MAG: DUF4398 domain-containing protein [Leptospirales bacterium]|nr:DUF4398 domain-containing protein [Leptospirales bacterium]
MRKLSFMIMALSISLLFAACGDPLPIDEMASAKKAISKAFSVKADKYAAEEINAATAKLYESHDFVKSDDMKKAASSAVEAEELARSAYNKSCPLLAKDTIDIAEQSLMEAAEVSAAEIAEQEYADASSALDAAKVSYESKNYEAAYVQAIDADRKAKEARTVALGKKDILKDSIDEVRITLQKAREYGADEYASENMQIAEENLLTAEDAYADLKLKTGFAAVEVAKINADEAYLTAVREAAREEMDRARVVIERAENVSAGKPESDELAAAKEAYRNAEAMYEEGRYREAIEFAKEASLLSNIVVATAAGAQGKDEDMEKDKEKSLVLTDDDADSDKDYFLYTVVYKEKLKDCLWRIADKYYKNPHKWKSIYNANKDKIKNPDLIYPGWIIKVPKL